MHAAMRSPLPGSILASAALSRSGRGRTVEGDFPCRSCGYNLRGLPYGSRCPECGLPMRENERWTSGSFLPRLNILLPPERGARRRLEIGFLLAAAAMIIMLVVGFIRGLPVQTLGAGHASIILTVANGLWLGAVLLLTPRTLTDYGRRFKFARWFVRGSAVAWIVAHGAALLVVYGPTNLPGEWVFHVTWYLGRFLGTAGMLVFFLILSVASWDADRDDVGRRLMTVFWGVLCFGAIMLLAPRGLLGVSAMGPVVVGLFAPFALAWAIFMGVGVWCMLTLHGTVRWVTTGAQGLAGRPERIKSTREEIDRQVKASIRPWPGD
ncbi:MAG: hypothetical protein KJZ68_13685 [Phycisphaerales bacterium]|nr:hypothetical protein [Phycisphaerales bacterium]